MNLFLHAHCHGVDSPVRWAMWMVDEEEAESSLYNMDLIQACRHQFTVGPDEMVFRTSSIYFLQLDVGTERRVYDALFNEDELTDLDANHLRMRHSSQRAAKRRMHVCPDAVYFSCNELELGSGAPLITTSAVRRRTVERAALRRSAPTTSELKALHGVVEREEG